MSLAPRLIPAVALLVAGTFVLSGCGPASAPAESAPPPAATTAAPEPVETTEPEPVVAADDPACLVGDWLITEEALTRYFAEVAGSLGAPITFAPVGTAGMHIGDDGTYSYTPAVTITQTMAEITTVIKLGGTIEGTYVATPGVIKTDAVTTNGLVIEASVNDIVLDPTAISEEITGAPIGNATFVCSADALTLTTTIADAAAVTELVRQ